MKRNLTIVASMLALAVPAIALAQTTRVTHVGKLDGVAGSQVKFKEATRDGSRELTSFAVRDFELDCKGGTVGLIEMAKLTGRIAVDDDGTFKINDDDGKTVFKAFGAINRNKAIGRFRYSGRIEDDGVTRLCDSGRLSWITRP